MLETNIIPFGTAALDLQKEASGELLTQLENVIISRGGYRLLDCLNLNIRSGGITVMMGANGAGKTLTLKLIAGLIKADDGAARLCGLKPCDVGIMFQKPILLRRSVEANMLHALKIYGVPKPERNVLIDQYLQMADLTDFKKRPARRLSGGEQQRLSLIRAIAASPKLLLLDEPTSSLDPRATKAVEDLIQKAVQEGIKILLVTHDKGQAQRLADEVCFLHQGRLTEQTSTSEFFTSPASPEANAYLQGQLLA